MYLKMTTTSYLNSMSCPGRRHAQCDLDSAETTQEGCLTQRCFYSFLLCVSTSLLNEYRILILGVGKGTGKILRDISRSLVEKLPCAMMYYGGKK